MAAAKPFIPLDEKFLFNRQLDIAARLLCSSTSSRSSIPLTEWAFFRYYPSIEAPRLNPTT